MVVEKDRAGSYHIVLEKWVAVSSVGDDGSERDTFVAVLAGGAA